MFAAFDNVYMKNILFSFNLYPVSMSGGDRSGKSHNF